MQAATASTRPTGMLVVDDHGLVRLGLRSLIQSYAAAGGRSVAVFEAASLAEALALYAAQQALIGLVLMDLHLPDAHGLSGLRSFRERFPAARVVVVSGDSDPALQREALAQGASAYLTKSGDLHHVVQYLRSLGHSSDTRAPSTLPGTATRVVCKAGGEPLQLSVRQAQILDWVLAGLSNQQIAEQARLGEGTVKNHVSALLLLFEVRSRAQLISQLR
nr:response regulator transcription factor [uncultured Albidiferax sp.]